MPETCAFGASNYLAQLSADEEKARVSFLKQEKARVGFLLALLEIEKHGYCGKPVDGNPLQLLRDQVWPKWHAAVQPRQVVTRRRTYLDFVAQQDENRRAMSAILDQWATDCWLVESDEDGKLRPAGWVVMYAEIFQGLNGSKLGHDEPVWWERFRQSGTNETESGLVLPSVAPAIAQPSGLFVPMDCPSPRVGEPWKEFRRRAKRSLADHLHFWERAWEFAAPKGIENGRRAARARRRKRDGLEHYTYLVLYQCCGWSLEKIAKLASLTAQAVSQGLRAKAGAVGIRIRSQTLKKKHRKSAETGH